MLRGSTGQVSYAESLLALPWRRLLALLAGALLVASCASTQLLLANVPAWFGSARRTTATYAPDRRLAVDVFAPATATAPRPVIIFLYGGSWQWGSRRQYGFVGQTLAGAGYVAVLPDYRKYPGVRFPEFVRDTADAVAWTLRHARDYGGDPEAVFLMGHSAGAHLALLTALDPRYLAAAGVSPGALRGVIGLSGPYDFALDSATLRGIFAASGDAIGLPDYRPLVYAGVDSPPALLIHGQQDQVVYPRNSRRLATALATAGVPVTLELLPGLGHGAPVAALSGVRRNLAPVLPAIRRFIDARTAANAPAPTPAVASPPL